MEDNKQVELVKDTELPVIKNLPTLPVGDKTTTDGDLKKPLKHKKFQTFLERLEDIDHKKFRTFLERLED